MRLLMIKLFTTGMHEHHLYAEESMRMHRDTLHNGGTPQQTGMRRSAAVVIFAFFAHKKYSHSFIKLRLNH